MVTWPDTLSIEESRLKCVYKLLHGLIEEDIRELHIPGDIRTRMKLELEIKGWNRNGWLPLETWSVIENQVLGWGWNSTKLQVWFVRYETEEALGVSLSSIQRYLHESKVMKRELLLCEGKYGCRNSFEIAQHTNHWIVRQAIQATGDRKVHRYHSACLFVKPDAFKDATYLGKHKIQTEVLKPRLLQRSNPALHQQGEPASKTA